MGLPETGHSIINSLKEKGTNKNLVENAGDCIVNPNDINDIFPIMFYDGTVVPASRAGWYVFNNF